LADGLGSVRTEVVSDKVEAVNTYSPYGNLLAQTGDSGTVYGFTGEQYDSAADLLFLRARYYNTYLNRFLSVDPIVSYLVDPQDLNPYSYVRNDPINNVDPTGLWRWRVSSGNIYHDLVENHFEGSPFGVSNPTRQIEYTIPGIGTRPDIFDVLSGAVFEIEPVYLRATARHGTAQALRYAGELNAARAAGALRGTYLRVIPYSWNGRYLPPFHLGGLLDWPGYKRWSQFPYIDLVADYVPHPTLPGPSGLIIYWLEPKAGISTAEARLIAPNPSLVRNRGWNPITGRSPVQAPVPPTVPRPPVRTAHWPIPSLLPTLPPGLGPTNVELIRFEVRSSDPILDWCQTWWNKLTGQEE
jgi:RHS repeat-associated protein